MARAGDSWLLPFLRASDQQAAGCFTLQFPVIFERKSQVPLLINFNLVAPHMRAVLAKKTKCSKALLWSEGPLLTVGPRIKVFQVFKQSQDKPALLLRRPGIVMLVFFFASDHSQAARGSHVTTGVYVTAAPTVNTTKKWQERGLSLSALIKQYRSQLAAS